MVFMTSKKRHFHITRANGMRSMDINISDKAGLLLCVLSTFKSAFYFDKQEVRCHTALL